MTITPELSHYITHEILRQPKRQIIEDTVLVSSGLVDSFHLVDLATYVEEQYGVRIEDTELNADTFDTLGQLVALIQSRL